MLKIGIIAPYEGLKEVATRISASHQEVRINVESADLEEAVEPARRLEELGYHVLISRGGTAQILRERSSLPVVEIDVSGYDILRTLLLFKDSKDPIELIGFPNVCHGVNQVAELLGISISYQVIHSSQEVQQAVENAISRNIQVIIGDTVTLTTARRFGLEGIMITSGPESVEQAVVQAKEVGSVLLYQEAMNTSYHHLLEHLPESIALVKETGELMFANQPFLNLFQLTSHASNYADKNDILQSLHQKMLNYAFLQENFSINGRSVIAEGEFLVEGKERLYFLKISDENRYRVEQNGLVIQPLQSDIVSFGQISTADERVRSIVERAKKFTESVYFLQGENGTGKRSIAAALHHYRNNYIENQWEVILDKDFDEMAMKRLEAMILSGNGTFYMKNWEALSAERLEQLFEAAFDSVAVIIFAAADTNQPLLQEKFQKKSIVLSLPPLRERIEHLPEYIRTFIARNNSKYGKQVVGVESGLLLEWKSSRWPGNLHELQEMVEMGVKNSEGPYISREAVQTNPASAYGARELLDLNQSLDNIEKQVINLVLQEENMNQTRAAQRLDINRSTLWRKLKG
ncbi:hypothetical protein CHL76_09060 [Marinococcus halophilus]|uniref:Sigma-54-dependent Fis family transcriptional regulator n=1 Tax=Marinococcus halophilus TaxID=1371 RepID=A0A510Y6G8_MARHA|nr:sigma-54-dependent Fis family transcriptional regulator [Marinococcus halophilus]OZT80245.1 hypothetical protein CHL76_09060 [Marinococcus halophilus]GEK58301.1 sigma-54-dependent Fis family transcriptional regulator [Marinococcus halophilus]